MKWPKISLINCIFRTHAHTRTRAHAHTRARTRPKPETSICIIWFLTNFDYRIARPPTPPKILEKKKTKKNSQLFCKFGKFFPFISKFFSKSPNSLNVREQTPTFPFRVYKYYIPLNGRAGDLLGFARWMGGVCSNIWSRFARFY